MDFISTRVEELNGIILEGVSLVALAQRMESAIKKSQGEALDMLKEYFYYLWD